MIEYLSGKLIEKSPTKAILLCGGVGYAPLISLATYEQLPDIEHEASLYTYLVVREDAMTLFGFTEIAERDMFLLLTSVNGVGPKISLNILSSMGIDMLKENIAAGNSHALTTLPGIGKKMAERIALELRDKISSLASDSPTSSVGNKAAIRQEALAALMALGYSRAAAEKSLRDALKEGPSVEVDVESLIKAALREANR